MSVEGRVIAPVSEAPVFEFTPGGAFVLDSPWRPDPIWGLGEEVLHADGEAMMIAGEQGLGKTTIAQQYALGRCGFAEYASLLGFPIKPGTRRVLYLAMDRPRQAARSLRRMVGDAWRDELDGRLLVWQGPPPWDLAKHPKLLRDMCSAAEADTVIVDSLKDAAIGLTDDEVGAGYNRARQTAIAAGIQVVELHHLRKAGNGAPSGRARTCGLDDLYGSTWLTSGAGSVLVLTGRPGDAVVHMQHVKQPMSEVGPLQVMHNHSTGRTTRWQEIDVIAIAAASVGGLSAVDLARVLFDTTSPTANEKKKAERKLQALVGKGALRVVTMGDMATREPTRWGIG